LGDALSKSDQKYENKINELNYEGKIDFQILLFFFGGQ
jgi:hypothetical protein